MDDNELLRYNRQILMPDFGIEGQQRLLGAHVLVIGVGGLGAPVAMYLAAAGIGQLTLVDPDEVELSNLQRQVIHHTDDIGRPKVESARNGVAALNPNVEVNMMASRLAGKPLDAQVSCADVVVDCSDNFATRFAINAACVRHRKPLVSGAVIRYEGQVSVFTNHSADDPCYRCLYPGEGAEDRSCSANGVLAPAAGIIGCIQATETIKLISGVGEPLSGRLLIMDAKTMDWRTIRLRRDPHCPVCSTVNAEH